VGTDANLAGWIIQGERPDIVSIVLITGGTLDTTGGGGGGSGPFVPSRVRILRHPFDNTVVATPMVG
jgi:hypothetical protein